MKKNDKFSILLGECVNYLMFKVSSYNPLIGLFWISVSYHPYQCFIVLDLQGTVLKSFPLNMTSACHFTSVGDIYAFLLTCYRWHAIFTKFFYWIKSLLQNRGILRLRGKNRNNKAQ